ncbi:uncharacterized protein LOC124930197 isoform X2 [Impatiens glandulifera]|uniref:uncharacterized protein LOC124930197 isoform X2 n=1 Tax=Impatiens glandulifera TaxID=253017 RepID=UPI001FB09A34|nr:uncharacterized protein LOC124930197 isoform X2 [Impatiens glandulifera]
MDFKSVYNSLLEVFPEIDTRVLRAVAIEHSKDATTAVEAVLTEIIPYLTKKNISSGFPSGVEQRPNLPTLGDDRNLVELPSFAATANASDGSSNICAIGDSSKSYVEDVVVESVSSGTQEESFGTPISSVVNCSLFHENSVESDLKDFNTSSDNGSEKGNQCIDRQDFGELSVMDVQEDILDNSHSDSNQLKNPMSGEPQVPAQEFTPDTSTENCLEEPTRCDDFEESQKINSSNENEESQKINSSNENEESQKINSSNENEESQKVNSSNENEESQPIVASAGDATISEVADFESEHSLNTVVTRSGQLCRIDMLEDIIEDAKDNKKTLFTSMEIVIGLMKEVELQEQAADCARKEAAKGGLDILTRVDELKEMLLHAKEANEMHAGEVYGERAILATEVKELQSRLFNLSDERDNSLNVLNEMREALEQRSLEAERAINTAKNEKLVKENVARRALTEQELVMEKVVEESRILKQEAEENTKLSEFLMDRGRVVDTLQGEISVICKDVKVLKQKFDERLPLCKSLCTSQTSCLLASSNSSLKGGSTISPEENTVPRVGIASEDSPSSPVEEKIAPSGSEVDSLVEDGWDFFDNHELELPCDGF